MSKKKNFEHFQKKTMKNYDIKHSQKFATKIATKPTIIRSSPLHSHSQSNKKSDLF